MTIIAGLTGLILASAIGAAVSRRRGPLPGVFAALSTLLVTFAAYALAVVVHLA